MRYFKSIVKFLIVVLALAALVLLGLWFFNAPNDLSKNSASQKRLDGVEYVVDDIVFELIDASRKTPALGDYSGDDKRVLNGTIWFPDGETGEHPLIIYSHGFGGYRRDSTYLVEYLAANGYVVAAVDFPLSHKDSPAGVPQLEDVVNQAGDVQQVIDYILSMNSDSASVLHQRIDVNNIGAMGLSLGGLTTALASFHPDVKDDRIKAAVMMAPPLQMFSDKFFATNSMVKSLIISGSMDRVVPQKVHATEVQARHPRGWFLSFDKGTHLGFADIGNYIRWMENPDNLGCAFMNFMLSKIDLPSQWDAVIPNTNGVLRKVDAATPCPNIPGESMNGLKQQWLTNIAIASFFDMYLRSGPVSQQATDFFTDKLLTENAEVTLTVPQQ